MKSEILKKPILKIILVLVFFVGVSLGAYSIYNYKTSNNLSQKFDQSQQGSMRGAEGSGERERGTPPEGGMKGKGEANKEGEVPSGEVDGNSGSTQANPNENSGSNSGTSGETATQSSNTVEQL